MEDRIVWGGEYIMMILKREPRSPLRYAGGKSRGVLEISKFIPNNTKEIVSPFLGGGSVELACANNGVFVYGYDNFKPLVEFWQCILTNPKKLVEIIRDYYPLSKPDFYRLRETQPNYLSKYERAAIFFVLNRSSFSGTTFSGGMSPNHPRFTESSIERVMNFRMKNISVELMDFKKSITRSKNKLLYLDPPYLLKNCYLYGKNGNMHNGFDHEGLSKILHGRDKWILSYNDTQYIRDLYSDYHMIRPEWLYGMSNNKTSREVLILSHDLVRCNK